MFKLFKVKVMTGWLTAILFDKVSLFKLKQYFILFFSIVIFFASVEVAKNSEVDKSPYNEPFMAKIRKMPIYDLGVQSDIVLKIKGITLKGFHGPEEFGRWTSKSRSTVDNILPINKGKIINICGFAFSQNVGVTGELIIGKSKYDIKFTEFAQCYEFLYNHDLVATKIIIDGFETISPKEIGLNDDTRKLGVAIKSIKVN